MTSLLLITAIASGNTARGIDFSSSVNPNSLYAYGSPEFNQFVDASFQNQGGSPKFYAWLNQAVENAHLKLPGNGVLHLDQYLASRKQDLASTSSPELRAKKERVIALELHRMIRKVLPNFDLDTGFEFKNSVSHGKRQCFLQSTLIASLLQRAGMNSGVAMVNRNIQGQETNNKHAVCVLRLANRRDVIVDASEDYAFAKQQGLFLDTTAGYRFLRPVYDGDFSIVSYMNYGKNGGLPLTSVSPLDRSFIRSQFDYYRGERTVGGVMAKTKTAKGLDQAAYFLSKSVEEDPKNPLAQYMLGRVFLYRRLNQAAAKSLDKAMDLYAAQGWVPPDERTSRITAHRKSIS